MVIKVRKGDGIEGFVNLEDYLDDEISMLDFQVCGDQRDDDGEFLYDGDTYPIQKWNLDVVKPIEVL